MSNLDQLIATTQTYQDAELASAIQQLKKDPAQLKVFLQKQQSGVYNNITAQKDNTIQKVYGDLDRATKVQESILMYTKRDQDLLNLEQNAYQMQQDAANSLQDDKNIAGRKNEMNEWSVNNKKDTLFVFSSLFIMLSGLICLTLLYRASLISSYLWVGLASTLIIIFILIVVNRSQYTDILRNKRYWNRKNFEGQYGKISLPSCPGLTSGITSSLQSAEQSLQSGLVNVANSAAMEAAAASQSIAQGANSMVNDLMTNAAPTSMPAPVKP